MNYYRHQTVKVRNSVGEITTGYILDKVETDQQLCYWVQVDNDVNIYEVYELDLLNDENMCVCGSRKLGHPGHSYYCNVK
jgi:hypothetical protein